MSQMQKREQTRIRQRFLRMLDEEHAWAIGRFGSGTVVRPHALAEALTPFGEVRNAHMEGNRLVFEFVSGTP